LFASDANHGLAGVLKNPDDVDSTALAAKVVALKGPHRSAQGKRSAALGIERT